MESPLALPIPAFSLGSFGSLAAHSAFWLGLSLVLFASGMGCVKLYGRTLSALIESRGTWLLKFGVSGSIRRFLKTSTTARIWTAAEEKANMDRIEAESQGSEIKRRLKEWNDLDDKRQHGLARIWGILSLGLLVASWAGGTMLALHDHQKIVGLEATIRSYEERERRDKEVPPVVIMHGVQVLDRINERTFHAQVKNPATGEWTAFDITSCPKRPAITDEIQAGVTLPLLQYVEDHEHRCMILDGRWGGYTLLRDRGVPILTAFEEAP